MNDGQHISNDWILFASTKKIGWENIQETTSGTINRTILDDTLPGEPVERMITDEAPWSKCDRVEDYRGVWEVFEKEGGSRSSNQPIKAGTVCVDQGPPATQRAAHLALMATKVSQPIPGGEGYQV